jgi:hypothetical protein
LSKLAVWWLRLAIQIERIRRGHPEQNGRHERMPLGSVNLSAKFAAFGLTRLDARRRMPTVKSAHHVPNTRRVVT